MIKLREKYIQMMFNNLLKKLLPSHVVSKIIVMKKIISNAPASYLVQSQLLFTKSMGSYVINPLHSMFLKASLMPCAEYSFAIFRTVYNCIFNAYI
jgi:hypothetical protein